MSEVPEGQVPRDAAFWRTYHAVQAEHAEAFARLECERRGHELEWTVTGDEPRCRCGMTAPEVYAEYEAQGVGRIERSADGLTFHWGRP